MANENPSRENPSRQQSSERAQGGAYQQGSGTQQGAGSSGSYGQGSRVGSTQGFQGQGAWQGGRPQQSGGALQSRRGGLSMSPYGGLASGYGGPFSMMRRISDEMDRLFESFGMGRGFFPGEGRQGGLTEYGGGEGTTSMWSPHIDVCERNGKLLIQADLPGMKRDDIHVRVEQDQVVIQGERQQDQSSTQGGYYRTERSYGSFYRTIPLPEGTDTQSASASFRDGVLEIELDAPRQQERGRTLEIRDAGSGMTAHGAGTGGGATYGGGTSGSMTGSTSGSAGAGQQSASGAASSHYAGSSGRD